MKLTVDRLKEQNDIQADRIRQLSSELNDRNQTVAHLSNQVFIFFLLKEQNL